MRARRRTAGRHPAHAAQPAEEREAEERALEIIGAFGNRLLRAPTNS